MTNLILRVQPKFLPLHRLGLKQTIWIKNVPKQLLALNTKLISSSNEGDIKENLYGKFFYDRAEFYIIKNPKNKIHSSSIKSITFV